MTKCVSVIPAEAGIQIYALSWIPTFVGMTPIILVMPAETGIQIPAFQQFPDSSHEIALNVENTATKCNSRVEQSWVVVKSKFFAGDSIYKDWERNGPSESLRGVRAEAIPPVIFLSPPGLPRADFVETCSDWNPNGFSD